MTQQTINIGAAPNDATGDPLRTAFTKCNANFTELYGGSFTGLDIVNGTTATSLKVYNTYTDAANFERGVFDWTTTANKLTIGMQKAGTGSWRDVRLVGDSAMLKVAGGEVVARNDLDTLYATLRGGTLVPMSAVLASDGVRITFDRGFHVSSPGWDSSHLGANVPNDGAYAWSSTTAPDGTRDTGLSRNAAGVVEVNTGTAGTRAWMQWAGQARVTTDVSSNNTTTLALATGLTVALQAGRTYSFEAEISFTCTAAQGIRAAMVASGGLTATDIIYDGWIIDSAANGIKGNAQATALGTVVANAATIGTAGHITIQGTITVNVAGSLQVHFAQSVAAANNTTVKRGSRLIVHDMP